MEWMSRLGRSLSFGKLLLLRRNLGCTPKHKGSLQWFCCLDFSLLISSLTVSSNPHKTAVVTLSNNLQTGADGPLVTPLSDELRVILFVTRSTRRVFTRQIGEQIGRAH